MLNNTKFQVLSFNHAKSLLINQFTSIRPKYKKIFMTLMHWQCSSHWYLKHDKMQFCTEVKGKSTIIAKVHRITSLPKNARCNLGFRIGAVIYAGYFVWRLLAKSSGGSFLLDLLLGKAPKFEKIFKLMENLLNLWRIRENCRKGAIFWGNFIFRVLSWEK